MKLTKRDRKLLQVLCGTLILLGYFHLILDPQWQKLKELKEVKEAYNKSIEAVEFSMESKDFVETEIVEIVEEVEALQKLYFDSIDQGNIILLMDQWIEASGLGVPALTFSEYRVEILAEEELETIALTVPFEGEYGELQELLRKIRNHENRVLISQLNIQNNLDGSIKGRMLLDFYKLKDNGAKGEEPFIAEDIKSVTKNNPFSPYQGFFRGVTGVEEIVEEMEGYLPTQEALGEYGEDNITGGGKQGPKESNIVLGLNDFEVMDTFFVGEPRDMVGDLVLDGNAQSGKYSLLVDYDFIRPRQRSVANVVFEGEPMMIEYAPELLQLSIYSYGEANHGVSLILKDSKGQEYTVSLAQQIDWRGWEKLKATLPKEISYPARLQRITIEARDFDPVTNGILLLDKLEAAYQTGAVLLREGKTSNGKENEGIYEVPNNGI
ncbi:hypothetical protein [Alkaliphilus hydrothermalis]|uniref:Type IV pilus assembly protein PilO n=1 Tax=Alkaliphilus hydrothermalis TaxID=1482730 RepID=A0ABS2NM13_9FIRM|nr:hypothetical protein [Alkaliphilus hydrothermalis]MBM7613988.1 type IV pilus assembly protein PilO [Alkaliphilus hydrothermalis]